MHIISDTLPCIVGRDYNAPFLNKYIVVENSLLTRSVKVLHLFLLDPFEEVFESGLESCTCQHLNVVNV